MKVRVRDDLWPPFNWRVEYETVSGYWRMESIHYFKWFAIRAAKKLAARKSRTEEDFVVWTSPE